MGYDTILLIVIDVEKILLASACQPLFLCSSGLFENFNAVSTFVEAAFPEDLHGHPFQNKQDGMFLKNIVLCWRLWRSYKSWWHQPIERGCKNLRRSSLIQPFRWWLCCSIGMRCSPLDLPSVMEWMTHPYLLHWCRRRMGCMMSALKWNWNISSSCKVSISRGRIRKEENRIIWSLMCNSVLHHVDERSLQRDDYRHHGKGADGYMDGTKEHEKVPKLLNCNRRVAGLAHCISAAGAWVRKSDRNSETGDYYLLPGRGCPPQTRSNDFEQDMLASLDRFCLCPGKRIHPFRFVHLRKFFHYTRNMKRQLGDML